MANTKLLRAATLDRIGDLVDDTAGVHLRAGLLVEIRSGGRHIITSPVLAITTEQASSVVVH